MYNKVKILVTVDREVTSIVSKRNSMHLSINDCEITSDTVDAILKLKNLEKLNTSKCGFMDDSYNSLPKLNDLHVLDISSTTGIDRFDFVNDLAHWDLTLFDCGLNNENYNVDNHILDVIDLLDNPDLENIDFVKNALPVRLNIENTSVSDLSPLSSCDRLYELISITVMYRYISFRKLHSA